MMTKRRAGRKAQLAAGVAALAVMFSAVVTFGYNPFQDNLGTLTSPIPVVAYWNSMPLQWLLNASTPNNNVTDCSGSLATCIQDSLTAGFTTWSSAMVAGQSLTTVSANYAGASSLTTPVYNDCQNVIGFSDTNSSDFSTGTIAFTQIATVTRPSGSTGSFTYQCSDGSSKVCDYDDCIGDADMEFNPTITFSISLSPPSGDFSLQSVATHEEGHMLGLDHSGIAHAIMFPYGDSTAAGQQTVLSTDDAVGISFMYPSANFSTATGTISGQVSVSGSGVFGAHVVAIDSSTGNAVVDGLTYTDGSYFLVGVPPGYYYILALPLAPDSNTGVLSIDNFSGWDCGFADPTDSTCSTFPQNPTNYTGRYH